MCSAAAWPWPERVKVEAAAGTTVGELGIAVEAADSGSSRAAATAVVRAGGSLELAAKTRGVLQK